MYFLAPGPLEHGGAYSVLPFTLLLPGVPAQLTFLARPFVSGGMLYSTQYQWLSFGPGMVCMIRARLFVPAGTQLHSSGRVVLLPSQVYSWGSIPPSTTSRLRITKVESFNESSAVREEVPSATGAGVDADGTPGDEPGFVTDADAAIVQAHSTTPVAIIRNDADK